jgi:hypothetical protein
VGTFQNVIVCEDVREEIGGKKSLIGVFPGDILVPQFPITLQLALYFEYKPEKIGSSTTLEFRLMQDDTEMAKGRAVTQLGITDEIAAVILPRGLAGFDHPCKFRLLVSENGAPEIEVVSKRIAIAPTFSPSVT